MANLFITGHICIDDHLVNVCEDIKLPIRCVKCQEYGHTCDAFIRVDKCANCASVSHSTSSCVYKDAPSCASCGANLVHTSSLPKCPVFIKKCAALEDRTPENAMPYFPTNEAWTWASAPTNPPQPTSLLPEMPPMWTSSCLQAPHQDRDC